MDFRVIDTFQIRIEKINVSCINKCVVQDLCQMPNIYIRELTQILQQSDISLLMK